MYFVLNFTKIESKIRRNIRNCNCNQTRIPRQKRDSNEISIITAETLRSQREIKDLGRNMFSDQARWIRSSMEWALIRHKPLKPRPSWDQELQSEVNRESDPPLIIMIVLNLTTRRTLIIMIITTRRTAASPLRRALTLYYNISLRIS